MPDGAGLLSNTGFRDVLYSANLRLLIVNYSVLTFNIHPFQHILCKTNAVCDVL